MNEITKMVDEALDEALDEKQLASTDGNDEHENENVSNIKESAIEA